MFSSVSELKKTCTQSFTLLCKGEYPYHFEISVTFDYIFMPCSYLSLFLWTSISCQNPRRHLKVVSRTCSQRLEEETHEKRSQLQLCMSNLSSIRQQLDLCEQQLTYVQNGADEKLFKLAKANIEREKSLMEVSALLYMLHM